MGRLKDKRALITGATGGIGQAIVRFFLKEGAAVVGAGTSADKLNRFKQQLETDGFSEAVFVEQAILSETGAAEKLIENTKAQLGGIDIIVNNAGITRDGLLMRMKESDWDDVMQVNLKAVMQLCKTGMMGMMRQRSGSIINISSVVAAQGNPGQCNYVAAKAALEGFSKTLAAEVGSRGVRVNCVAPGFIETPMTEGLRDSHKQALMDSIPLKRLGKPEDVAEGVVFLASEASAYITGSTLKINGGMERS